MEYDVVLLGSGPLHVIEAAYLSRQGKSVLILERGCALFGAWKTIPHPLFGQVEMGCHIMERYQGVYRFLAEFLQLEMIRVKPAPTIIRNGRKLPYDWKWNMHVAQSFLKHSKRLNFGKFMQEVSNNHWKIHFRSGVYRYPKGGSAAFEKALNNTILNEKIQIQTETQVNHLIRKNKCWDIITNKGLVFAKNVYISSLSDLESICTPEKQINPEYSAKGYHHFHLLIEADSFRQFEYLRILDNPVVHRISNITEQVKEPLPSNQRLLLVGVFSEAMKCHITAEKVFQETCKILSDAKYSVSIKLLNAQQNSYYCKYLSSESIEALQSMESIHHLASTNLTLSFWHRLNDWRNVLID